MSIQNINFDGVFSDLFYSKLENDSLERLGERVEGIKPEKIYKCAAIIRKVGELISEAGTAEVDRNLAGNIIQEIKQKIVKDIDSSEIDRIIYIYIYLRFICFNIYKKRVLMKSF